MASTDAAPAPGDDPAARPGPIEHPLGTDYLDGLLALSAAAGWNQDADDWRSMLSLGRGWGLSEPDGTLLASTVVLPYEGAPPAPDFAWVSMVLVLPEHRRRGFASHLLRTALAWLSNRGLTPILDATPQGHPVYRQEGFQDTWGFARLERPVGVGSGSGGAAAVSAGVTVERLREEHWPALAALDAAAFGGRREPLLRTLAARLPEAAHVARRDGSVTGFVLGRPGRVATQIGPLVCHDAAVAAVLLDAALAAAPGRVFVDLPDAQQVFAASVAARGFVPQRPFTRLVHPGTRATPPTAPGDAAATMLVAGPELG